MYLNLDSLGIVQSKKAPACRLPAGRQDFLFLILELIFQLSC